MSYKLDGIDLSKLTPEQLQQLEDLKRNFKTFDYYPSLAMNGTLLALFAVALILFLVQGIRYRTWLFMFAMCTGCAIEVGGYAGRIWAHFDIFTPGPFLTQIVLLTIGPAFLAAGIYLSLSQLVTIFGAKISRIPPHGYTYIFVGCDLISLILQGTGGGIASRAAVNRTSPQLGTDIMLAGLGFQVAALGLFILLCAEYALRVVLASRRGELVLEPEYRGLVRSVRFKLYLVALTASTLLILARCIFRVVELAEGWRGKLIKDEVLFFVLEGIMVILAVFILNAFHPGWCIRESYGPGKGTPSDGSSFSPSPSSINMFRSDPEMATTTVVPPQPTASRGAQVDGEKA